MSSRPLPFGLSPLRCIAWSFLLAATVLAWSASLYDGRISLAWSGNTTALLMVLIAQKPIWIKYIMPIEPSLVGCIAMSCFNLSAFLIGASAYRFGDEMIETPILTFSIVVTWSVIGLGPVCIALEVYKAWRD